MDRIALKTLPKVELHLHLDCSLSFDAVSALRPRTSRSEYEELFIAPEKCIDLADFLRCTVSGIALMQSESELRRVVQDLFDQLNSENVIYAEIRFAPLQHLDGELEAEDVVEIVADAISEETESTGIGAGLILCTLRHYTEGQSLRTVKLVDRSVGDTPVVGLDLAADEAGFEIDAHVPAFEYAIRKDIPRTAHAGEARGAESVAETLRLLRPHRIGHGVRSIEDEHVVDSLMENGVHLEICPTSNVQTNIYDVYEDHPIDKLFRAGVSLGINTDARSLVNVSLTDEYEKLAGAFGWGFEHFAQCNVNAILHTFASNSERDRLEKLIRSGYEAQFER